ncbi:sulfate transmembrane transporter [Actinidia rufa]|uniref:Sulfate transmembrane transporter n=1 Tax=Actinidia rufa TaxID=165716 RepID=A0A7J0EWQ5_9ERIC|nr:sulfate transmembrane transporter [Actinidia rufa]
MGVAEVFDSGEGEGEPLGELNASGDGERDDPVEDGHESGGAEEEEDGNGGDSCGGDLGGGEVGGFGDGDGGGDSCGKDLGGGEGRGSETATTMAMRVVERSRWKTRVRERTMGMQVPRSPTTPLSSDQMVVLRRRLVARRWRHR